LGLIADSSLSNGEDLDDPIDIAKEAVLELKSIMGELEVIIKELE
jgi:type I restriction enzyme M protein